MVEKYRDANAWNALSDLEIKALQEHDASSSASLNHIPAKRLFENQRGVKAAGVELIRINTN